MKHLHFDFVACSFYSISGGKVHVGLVVVKVGCVRGGWADHF